MSMHILAPALFLLEAVPVPYSGSVASVGCVLSDAATSVSTVDSDDADAGMFTSFRTCALLDDIGQ